MSGIRKPRNMFFWLHFLKTQSFRYPKRLKPQLPRCKNMEGPNGQAKLSNCNIIRQPKATKNESSDWNNVESHVQHHLENDISWLETRDRFPGPQQWLVTSGITLPQAMVTNPRGHLSSAICSKMSTSCGRKIPLHPARPRRQTSVARKCHVIPDSQTKYQQQHKHLKFIDIYGELWYHSM